MDGTPTEVSTQRPRVNPCEVGLGAVTLSEYFGSSKPENIGDASRPFIIRSPLMHDVAQKVKTYANSSATVLIIGKSGTGKELVARALHDQSSRRSQPFVALNLSAFPRSMIESQLFGYEKGSFTGAQQEFEGFIAKANGGTLFLDEIGDLPKSIQVKLLRVLEYKTFQRLGSTKERQSDFRLVAATNRDLKKLVEEGKFREDLYYRLDVLPIQVPSLDRRREDIPALIDQFITELNVKTSRKAITMIEPKALQALEKFKWRGNVRQLRSAIEYSFTLEDPSSDLIHFSNLKPEIQDAFYGGLPLTDNYRAGSDAKSQKITPPVRLNTELFRGASKVQETFERELLSHYLQVAGGNSSEAARLAGIRPSDFPKVLSSHRVDTANNSNANTFEVDWTSLPTTFYNATMAFQRTYLQWGISQVGGDLKNLSVFFGTTPSIISRRLKKYEITLPNTTATHTTGSPTDSTQPPPPSGI